MNQDKTPATDGTVQGQENEVVVGTLADITLGSAGR